MLMIIIFYLYQIVKPQNQMSSSSEVNNFVDLMICWSQLLLYSSPLHTHSSETYHYTQMLFVSNNCYTFRDMYNYTSTEFHLLATNLFKKLNKAFITLTSFSTSLPRTTHSPTLLWLRNILKLPSSNHLPHLLNTLTIYLPYFNC